MQPVFGISLFRCLSHLVVSSAESDEYKLENLQVLFRHGDRTPDISEIFVNDPNNEIYRNHGYGQLTKIGKEREYKIGQMLRERYNDFLGEYENNKVYAYSSDYDRTKISLQLVLAGLYPPTPSTSWSNSINWQPIPTHYEDLDHNFLSTVDCPVRRDLYHESLKSPEILKLVQGYELFTQRIENNTGISMKGPFFESFVFNNLHAALSLGLPLPSWCSKSDYQQLEKIMAMAEKSVVRTELLKRIFAGPLVERFLKVLNDNESSTKVYMYSGHEFNIAAFIHSHNITGTPGYPDYGSALILEKLKGPDDRSYIRIYFWTGATQELISLKLENCDKTCLLTDYEKIVQTILPNQASRVPCHAKKIIKKSESIKMEKLIYNLLIIRKLNVFSSNE